MFIVFYYYYNKLPCLPFSSKPSWADQVEEEVDEGLQHF